MAVVSQSHAMLFAVYGGTQIWYHWSWLVQRISAEPHMPPPPPLPPPPQSSPTSRPEALIRLTLFPPSVVWACVEIWSWLWHQNKVYSARTMWHGSYSSVVRHRHQVVCMSLYWWCYCVVRTVGQYCVCVCVCLWHTSLCMWCGAVYSLICGTEPYVCGVVQCTV
jgi:hypothetical protein